MKKDRTAKLRSGFTTGAAAAAAAKGALLALLSGEPQLSVRITFLTGAQTEIALHDVKIESPGRAAAIVIKDAGDDPDVTHKAEIGARVALIQDETGERVVITGGKGVGVVTKPGLEISPGNPAINPGPRRMITREVIEVLEAFGCRDRVTVEVFVPKGEELAAKTLNARLGIIGGLSILGTTGIERPMSHDAYLATIAKALSVARACKVTEVVLTTGRRSERFAQMLRPDLAEEAFVQIGDFFKASLEMAAAQRFKRISLIVFFGKALKMAQGTPHTHAARSDLSLERLACWTETHGNDMRMAEEIRDANTARHAFDLLRPRHLPVIETVAQNARIRAEQFAGNRAKVRAVILDYDGRVVAGQSD